MFLMIKFPRVHCDGLEYAVVHFEKVINKITCTLWNECTCRARLQQAAFLGLNGKSLG